MPKMTETDNAYAAGILDGEGSIAISGRAKTALCIYVGNSDPRMCVWLKERYGGSIYQSPSRIRNGKSTRIMYQWQLASASAGAFLKAVYPYLVIKKEQADIAFAYLATKGKSGQRVEVGDHLYRLDLIDRLKETRNHRPPLKAVK
jgi:hypothetical protein